MSNLLTEEIAKLVTIARRGVSSLSERDSKAFIRALGIPVPQHVFIRKADEAAQAFGEIGAPVVAKVVSSKLTHKTEVGGVIFPIGTPQAAEAACRTIEERVRRDRPDLEIEGFLLEAYRPSEIEWILSLRVDPRWGPVVMFGLGGIYVDVMQQITFRLAPLREQDIDALITEQPVMRVLRGVRGRPPADIAALRSAIRRFSDLATMPDVCSSISEIEINPLTIEPHGVLCLDAIAILQN